MRADRVIEQVAERPRFVVMVTAILSLLAVLVLVDLRTGQLRLSLDASTESLLPEDNADRALFERVRSRFGDTEAVLLSVGFDPMFTPENMARIESLSKELAALDGVNCVFSLATASNVLAEGEDLDVSTFTAQAARDPESVKGFAKLIDRNPLYRGVLVSEDGRNTLFAIALSDGADEFFGSGKYAEKIRALAAQHTGSQEIWIAGNPVLKAATTAAMLETLKFSLPLIYGLMLVILVVAFQDLRAALAVVIAISVAMLWTAAIAVHFGISINLITVITPPLVMTLGLAYAFHLLSEYFRMPAESRSQRTVRAKAVIGSVGSGLLLAGATTIAGFLALASNPLPAIQDFAILSSAGIAFLVVCVLLFLPSLLDVLKCRVNASTHFEQTVDQAGDWLSDFAFKWRKLIIGLALVIVPINLWLASGITVGTDYVKAFREGAQVRAEFEQINETFNGANIASISIETHVQDALTDPKLARGIASLQSWLEAQPEVGQTVSYVDHLKLFNQSLNNNDPAYRVIPDRADVIKQLLLFSGSEEISRVIDASYQSALVTIRLKVSESIEISRFIERVEARLSKLEPPLNGQITGTPVLATRTINAIGRGQWISLAVACVAIWAMLALMFTSVRAGLWTLLPNLVPVSIYFAALRILEIPLNPTNSLIASIVLGVAVDDTVHYLTRFNREARATGSEARAARAALKEILRPATLTTVALCVGLLALTGSELVSLIQFGILASLTLLLAWISELVLTPALGSRLRIVTLWDLLRLDLGQSPQHTIPLMAGLSLRQARVFALMSKLENFRPGDRVIKEGDFSRDMFVIVDGQLEVTLERPEERKVLTSIGRGAVIGEAGYFGQRRTANVDCVSAVRLLRFDSTDLERLRRRYPWIAALIFRNLNRVQAERLARTTAMIQ